MSLLYLINEGERGDAPVAGDAQARHLVGKAAQVSQIILRQLAQVCWRTAISLY